MDPSVEQLVAFKALVVAKNPLAVACTAAYEKTKDKSAFYAGIREALSSAAKKTTPAPSAAPAPWPAATAAGASSGGQNGAGGAGTSSAATKPKSATPCFAFKETGVCKNEKCRFSHDAPSKPESAPVAAALAGAAAPATAPAPAAAANSLGRRIEEIPLPPSPAALSPFISPSFSLPSPP